MSKASVRQAILLRSVQRLLDDNEHVNSVVVMSTRHRWFWPYAIASGVAVGIVASLSGIEGSVNWILFALIGGAVAGIATTNYSVLAETTAGLVLCRSSRVRQYAKAITQRFASDEPLTMIASNVITSDWKLDGMIYTMTKRWEAQMRLLSMGASGRES